jgi:toluene monooxygenase system ferredoxin subunit
LIPEEAAMSWVSVYADDELWDGDLVGVEAAGHKVLLLRSDGQVRAYRDVCPHKGTPLSDGELDGPVLTCPVHLWEFEVISGDSINPVGERLCAYPVRVLDGHIEVDVDADTDPSTRR